MNLPNKLTLFRICLIPIFIMFAMGEHIPNHYLWALIVFGIASFTDFLDGYLARKYNLITDFGKFMDPLADKMLVVSALIVFVDQSIISAITVIIIICREFLITSLRLIAASKGQVIVADMWGKAKTVVQMIAIISVMCCQAFIKFLPDNSTGRWSMFSILAIMKGSIDLAVILTVISGINYLIKNRKIWI